MKGEPAFVELGRQTGRDNKESEREVKRHMQKYTQCQSVDQSQ